MTARLCVHRAGLLAGALLASSLAGLCGCSDDTSSSTALTPSGPPALSIEDPSAGACLQLTEGDAAEGRVRIAVTNWSLRPPGVCGVYPQCGFAVFLVDGQELIRSASLVTDVPFGQLAEPSGSHTLRVELHDDTDEIALNADGDPLVAEQQVLTVLPGAACP